MYPSVNMLEEAKVKPQSDYSVNIIGQCPHCSKILSFGYIETVCNLALQLCPICGKDINVNPIEYCDFDKLHKNVEALLKGKGAALWAITPYNFYWLLESIPILKADNVKFINNNEIMLDGRTIRTLLGKEIFTPEIIRRENIDTVIVPNRLKVFKDIKEQCEAEFPQVKRIVHITELL